MDGTSNEIVSGRFLRNDIRASFVAIRYSQVETLERRDFTAPEGFDESPLSVESHVMLSQGGNEKCSLQHRLDEVVVSPQKSACQLGRETESEPSCGPKKVVAGIQRVNGDDAAGAAEAIRSVFLSKIDLLI